MKSLIVFASIFIVGVVCQDGGETQVPEVPQNGTLAKKERSFSFLQVMKFPNDVCPGNNARNGTCYSSDECTSKGGTASGTCANGFGVCCIFSIGCGQTSSENNTYLVLGATTTPSPSVCTYTLCENNPNVCKIRLDFTTFAINGPVTGSVRSAAAGLLLTTGGAIGDCTSDTFTLTAPGNRASPVICGTNSGQHIFIDTSSGGCAKATFDFGQRATSRSYDIKVTQYNCGDEMAGPSDCLQYFTTDTGTVKSFNYVPVAGSNSAAGDVTHLSNQLYTMCFRRNVGKCAICFIPSQTTGGAVITQESFGLSLSPAATAMSAVDAGCSTDYLIIPNGVAITTVKNVDTGATKVNLGNNRFCGRFLASGAAAAASASVCTGQRPFKIIFNSDASEVQAATTDAMSTEEFGFPGGIIGFSLDFVQQSC